jgi:hypothetical protein
MAVKNSAVRLDPTKRECDDMLHAASRNDLESHNIAFNNQQTLSASYHRTAERINHFWFMTNNSSRNGRDMQDSSHVLVLLPHPASVGLELDFSVRIWFPESAGVIISTSNSSLSIPFPMQADGRRWHG